MEQEIKSKALYYCKRANGMARVCNTLDIKADESKLRLFTENGQALTNAVVEIYTTNLKYEYLKSSYTMRAKELLKHTLYECKVTHYCEHDASPEVANMVTYNAEDTDSPFSLK